MSEIKAGTGRRARKGRRTRERIAEVALALFLERGFEETTLDAIAEAADISRRAFFNYYATKEAILDAVDEGIHDAFRATLTSASREQKPIEAVHTALQQMIGHYANDEAIAIDRLMQSTDALRARKQANYARQEEALFAALCEIWRDSRRRPGLRLVAMVGIGAMRVAADRWREAPDKRPLARELDHAFRELHSEMSSDSATS